MDRFAQMPRYFFDIHNDIDALDHEGKDLPDLEAALDVALGEARTMIQASVAETGRIDLRHHIDVREGGQVVHVMHFEDAVTVQRGQEIISRASTLRSV
jgi:hypothetical protein